MTLEQSILPAFVPPKPLDRVLKGIQTIAMFMQCGMYSVAHQSHLVQTAAPHSTNRQSLDVQHTESCCRVL